MAIYPAYVHVDNDGSASGYFPDVKGCILPSMPGRIYLQKHQAPWMHTLKLWCLKVSKFLKLMTCLTTFTVTHAITLMADSGIT